MATKEQLKQFKKDVRHVYEASPNAFNFFEEGLPEVAFIGRSNVGKSSLLNALVGRKDLARTSNTPGRTQGIQFFQMNDDMFLVDLPGYGYAKLSKTLIEKLNNLISAYLNSRRSLKRVFVLVDARHGLKDADREMLSFLAEIGVPGQVVLTKMDKLRGKHQEVVVDEVQTEVDDFPGTVDEVIAVSSRTLLNVDQLQHVIWAVTHE